MAKAEITVRILDLPEVREALRAAAEHARTAELRGAKRQREADAAEVLSIAATFREDSTVRVYLEAAIGHIRAQPLVGSTEGTDKT